MQFKILHQLIQCDLAFVSFHRARCDRDSGLVKTVQMGSGRLDDEFRMWRDLKQPRSVFERYVAIIYAVNDHHRCVHGFQLLAVLKMEFQQLISLHRRGKG